MDKRRYVSRNPRNPREPIGIASQESGDVLKDGYTVRHRKPLDRRARYSGLYGDSNVSDSLMDENEAAYGPIGDY